MKYITFTHKFPMPFMVFTVGITDDISIGFYLYIEDDLKYNTEWVLRKITNLDLSAIRNFNPPKLTTDDGDRGVDYEAFIMDMVNAPASNGETLIEQLADAFGDMGGRSLVVFMDVVSEDGGLHFDSIFTAFK